MQETVNTGHGDSDQDQPRYSCNNSDTTKLARMRQKENLETFLESLLLTEEHGYKTDGGSNTHTSLPPLSHVQRRVPSRAGNEPSQRLKFHNHGEG